MKPQASVDTVTPAVWIRLHRLAAVLLLGGCAALPPAPPRQASQALPADTPSQLATVARQSLPEAAMPGFQLLPVASAALAVRAELAKRAQHTLDVQYFIVEPDATGLYLLRCLRDAALRGVRVRLLVDDLHTAGAEQLLLALSAVPNVEVRLFNPIANGRWTLATRLLGALFDLDRVNRRMHNKLFVADNALALMGGRNIGDDYFMRGTESNFVDIDALAAGPVVQQLSVAFDVYWNNELSYPIASVVTPGAGGGDRLSQQQAFDAWVADVAAPVPDTGVPARLQRFTKTLAQLAAGRLALTQAPAQVWVDTPEKARGLSSRQKPPTVRARLIEAMYETQEEVFVVSPYFVPGELGLRRMNTLLARGVRLRLLTNSLAATDEPLVHIGYAAYRVAMLRAGVTIYELSPELARQRSRLGRFASSQGRLHAKAAALDGRRLFLGSMNFDPRSDELNTELGVLIDSPALTQEFLEMMDYRSSAYRLRLAADGLGIEWVHGTDGAVEVQRIEPESSWLLRFKLWLLAPFIPETHL